MRRVLPALKNIKTISRIHIASKSKSLQSIELIYRDKIGLWFDDYQEAIESSGAKLVYISLPNHLHFEWVKLSLNYGLNVVVEKPATLSLPETQFLLNLSAAKELCLAEATVWEFHPNIKKLKEILSLNNSDFLNVEAIFTVPDFKDNDFRNFHKYGGGAFNDMSAYAASVARVLFDRNPQIMNGKGYLAAEPGNVDTKFDIYADLGDKRIITGTFGFGMDYENKILITGDQIECQLDRVFSPPADLEIGLSVSLQGEKSKIFSQGDCYAEFFGSIINSLIRNDKKKWSDRLLRDAIVTDRLRDLIKTY